MSNSTNQTNIYHLTNEEEVIYPLEGNVAKKINSKSKIKPFWYTNEDGKYKLKLFEFYAAIGNLGFRRLVIQKNNTVIVKEENAIVNFSNNSEIKATIIEYINAHFSKIADKIISLLMNNDSRLFTKGLLDYMIQFGGEFLTDTKDTTYYTFSNGYVEIKQDSVELKDYCNLGHRYIWKDQIIPHTISIENLENEEFDTFLRTISRDNPELYSTITTSIGYLSSTYKDRSFSKAIILCDQQIPDTDEANGGTGKSIIAKSPKYVRNQTLIDGKTFNPNSQFAYQQINENTDIVLFDDVKRRFDLEKTFTPITEDWIVEKKNKHAFVIPFEDSPKVVMTTNYTLSLAGYSADRRKVEIPLPSVYNKDYTPILQFGHNLFDDWTPQQWNGFYNSMINYSQSFLKNGVVEYKDLRDLSIRKIIDATNHDFYDFASQSIELDTEYNKKTLFEDFVNHYPDNYRMKQRTFTTWIKKYATFTSLEFTDRNSGHNKIFMISSGIKTKSIFSDKVINFEDIEVAVNKICDTKDSSNLL